MKDPVNSLLSRIRDRNLAQKIASKPGIVQAVFELIRHERSKRTPDAIISEAVRAKLVKAQIGNKAAGALAVELLGQSSGRWPRIRDQRPRRRPKNHQGLLRFIKGLDVAHIPHAKPIELVADEAMRLGLTRQSAYPIARELLGLEAFPLRYVRIVQGGRADGNRIGSRKVFR